MKRGRVAGLLGGLGAISGALSAFGMHHDVLADWRGPGDIWLGPGLLFALTIGVALFVLRVAKPARAVAWAALVVLVWMGAALLAQTLVATAWENDNLGLSIGAGGVAGAIGALGVGVATRVLVGGFRTVRAWVGLTLAGLVSGLFVFAALDSAYPVFVLWQGVVAACIGASVVGGTRLAKATRAEQLE